MCTLVRFRSLKKVDLQDELSSSTFESIGDARGGDEQDGLLQFLTSTTKDELDRLDNLGGTFKVQSSKLTIDAVYNGQRLPSENWGYFKECFNLPPLLIKIIEIQKISIS